jgi:NAD(P)-dependent dehydrogenase (short-subunit alcohol dehydrogenase family)
MSEPLHKTTRAMSTTAQTLTDRRVILLGGSSGIGLATAKKAAAEGASVVIVSGSRHRVDEALKALPAGTEGHAIDLSKEENIRDFFSSTGRFDHLVYSAGENLVLSPMAQTNVGQARDFFTIRFWGAFAAVKYAAPLISEGGSIGLTSGTASIRPGAGWSVASAICGAMEGLVRALAVELAPIRVNCVVPGVITTPLWDGMDRLKRDELFRQVSSSSLVKRVGQPDDVAEGFLYLMRQRNGTGQSLLIDGGAALV